MMNRRTFLTLPALVPLTRIRSAFYDEEHSFQYEHIIGTSLDLTVWTRDSEIADGARRTVLNEIDRLASILDTRNPSSEIRRFQDSGDGRNLSPELREIFGAYDYWERRTGGVFSMHPEGPATPRNVDALGKAYILDRASKAVRESWPMVDGVLLNIGGDIVSWGRPAEIAVADPDCWYDNASPIAAIDLRNAAVATSGAYARGPHLRNARTGATHSTAAATVIAQDAVTANALATTLCVTDADYGLRLVESTPGAEALRIASGVVQRTSGFARLEREIPVDTPARATWPEGFQLTVTLPLTSGRSKKRPYVAVWVEDSAGELVQVLAFWGNNSKYFADLSTVWNLMRKKQIQIRSFARATRPAGKYELLWDGLDNKRKPVPAGDYRLVVETNQEHGSYAKQAGTITLGDSPANISLPSTANFETISAHYGPR